MKRFFEWLRSYILYACIDPREFPKIKTAMDRNNQAALHAFSRIAVVLFATALLLSRSFQIEVKIDQNFGYSFGLVLSLIIFFANYYLVPRKPRLLPWLIYLFDCVLFGFGFLLAFVCSPNQLTISLLVMFAIVPMFFTDRPYRLAILYFVLELLFIHLVKIFKPAEMVNLEIVNMVVYSSVGLILGTYMTRMKLERFVFEYRVNELTNQEQLTKYLKSISNIYVTMYHADLDTGMFMELRNDVDALKPYGAMGPHVERMLHHGALQTVDPDFLENAKKFLDLGTLKERLKGKTTITHEFLSQSGMWCRARYVNVDFDKKDELPRYVIFAVENISEQKQCEKALISQAETDAMTGLYNRNGGVSKIKEKMHDCLQGMLCLFDIDKFKSINDNYGHQAGDKVIVTVADAMQRTFRDVDVLLRLGGDEFMVFLSKVTNEELGAQAIGRFFTELNKVSIEGLEDYNIAVSLGATFFRGGKVDFDDLYRQADDCTYESKKIEGRSFTFWRG